MFTEELAGTRRQGPERRSRRLPGRASHVPPGHSWPESEPVHATRCARSQADQRRRDDVPASASPGRPSRDL